MAIHERIYQLSKNGDNKSALSVCMHEIERLIASGKPQDAEDFAASIDLGEVGEIFTKAKRFMSLRDKAAKRQGGCSMNLTHTLSEPAWLTLAIIGASFVALCWGLLLYWFVCHGAATDLPYREIDELQRLIEQRNAQCRIKADYDCNG